jgi:HEAT repeat protein
MATTEIDDVFARTLEGGYDDDAPWEAVHSLRTIGTREVFDRAAKWAGSPQPLKRARGLDVLAQLGKTADHRSNSFPQESYDLVSKALNHEREFLPLRSAIAALGHLDDVRAVPLVAQFRSDPSAEIRFSVACTLGSFPNDPLRRRQKITVSTSG